jgi:hypothetical protein
MPTLTTCGGGGYATTSSQITVSSTVSSPFNTLITIGTGTTLSYGYSQYYTDWIQHSNPLSSLSYNIDFEIDEEDIKDILRDNIIGIRKNKFIFNCNYVGNRIQPYEFLMKLIEEKKTFSVKVKISDILTINYVNLRFLKIENNLNFNTTCDYSTLKVKFEYEKILHENHKLSTKECRMDKIKKIIKNQDEDNND